MTARRADQDAACEFARSVASRIASGQPVTAPVSPVVQGAAEALAAVGSNVQLDTVAHEWAKAKAVLGDVPLADAVAAYKQLNARKRITFEAGFKAMVTEKQALGRGSYHIRDLNCRLGKSALTFGPRFLDEISTQELDVWLASLDCGPRTRNHYRDALCELFGWARRKGYLDASKPTAAEGTIAANVPPSPNIVFTPSELQTMLGAASDELRPLIALKAFTGLRTEELYKLTWSHIDLPGGHVKFTSDITKTSRRRLCPICPALRAWLERVPKAKRTGQLHSYSSAKTLSEALVIAARPIGSGKRNAFRNSYASYRLAELKDAAKVALEVGNSAKIIQVEYMELVTPTASAEWFAVMPLEKK